MSQLLSTRDPEILLRNAHRMLRRSHQYRRQVLWVFVSDITAFGATYSDQVCRELGWNPNAMISDPLPPRTVKDTTSKICDCLFGAAGEHRIGCKLRSTQETRTDLWDAHENSGMRHMERADVSGGETEPGEGNAV